MSLSINQAKINRQLQNPSESAYVVFPCNLETQEKFLPDRPPTVSSTIDLSHELEKYRDQVLSLRQRM